MAYADTLLDSFAPNPFSGPRSAVPAAPVAPLMAPLPAELPPPPKMRFFDVLAGAFGAGPDRMGAYKKGMDEGSQYRLRSAQTETAMQQAEQNRAEALRITQANAARARVLADPAFAATPEFAAQLATGANDWQNSSLGRQEEGFRSTLADPLATRLEQQFAGQGVQGKVLPTIEALDAGREYDNLTGDAYTNPIGAAQIANYQEQGAGGDFTINGVRYHRDASGQAAPVVPVAQVAADARAVADAKRAPPKVPAANMPAAIRNGFLENNATIDSIDATIEAVRANPASFGLRFMGGDTINQRIDPNGVGPRAMVANIGSAKIHERTGATMAAKEAPRLTPFVPSTIDQSDAIITKLEKLREEVLREQDGINQMYTLVPASIAAPAPGTPGVAAPAAPAAPAVDPRVQQYADQYFGGDVAAATALLRKRGAIQ